MSLENQHPLQFEEMWKYVGKTLSPIGRMPDKASLDHRQMCILYSELRESGNELRDLAQISILKKELAESALKHLAN